MRGLRRVLAGVAVLTAAYFSMWPVPIEPRSWRASAFRGYAGAHAPNNRLARLRRVSIEPHIGPEHIEVGRDGKLYTGVLSGAILRMNPDGSGVEVVANTGGRPLGLAFDTGGRLIVADAFRGLVTVRDGAVSVLLDEYHGKRSATPTRSSLRPTVACFSLTPPNAWRLGNTAPSSRRCSTSWSTPARDAFCVTIR